MVMAEVWVSRREIRRMLMEPKRRFTDRPWVVPALMAAILLAGLGIGIGVGIGVLSTKPENKAYKAEEQAETAVDRPARREAQPVPLDEPAPEPEAEPEPEPEPIVPVPEARPGGLADEGAAATADADADADAASPEPVKEAVPLILPQPSVQPVHAGSPAWIRHAVPAPKTAGRPMIAVVIDDLGVDKRRSERVTTLRAPLTLAWMTYAENLPRVTQAARQRGHELMIHVPMQPLGESWNPGPHVLEVGVDPEENRRRLVWGLERFEGFVGINNHMGSRYTGDRAGMRVVMEELRKRGLLFLDSVTTPKSVAPELARNYQVPFATRHIFIDNVQNVAAVTAQLAKAESYARKHGAAIAIGHPHDATIEALSQWLPALESKGLVLVPVSAIVRAGQSGS
jgi:polysaccharide deacetylase 2 family uncharacterized protein YibQ